MDTIRIGVPSGIGDISWLISKLVNAPQQKIVIEVADGWPYRAQDYIELLGGKFEFGGYGDFEYRDILAFEQLNPYTTWQDVVNAAAGRFLIQPNLHLERGKPLHTYLPDLPTNYHYPLHTTLQMERRATNLMDGVPRPRVGLSAASYRGAVAWKTWGYDEWVRLIRRIVAEGFSIVLMGGGWDDLTRGLEGCTTGVYSVVGQTSFGEAVEVHKLLDFYVGFSSGLGIIRTVLGLPTYMLWPAHQQPLSTSWADPADLVSGRYVATGYGPFEMVFNVFRAQVKRFA